MAPAFVFGEARKGGNAPDAGKVKTAAKKQATHNGHRMKNWVRVPTPMRGEEVCVCWCRRCGVALIWRSRYSIYSPRAEGDALTTRCGWWHREKGDGQNKTQTGHKKE